MTRRNIALLLGLMLLLMCACGGEKEDGSLKKVLDAGQLVLGLDENYPPMGFRDASGEITGFDIDLAKEVAKRMGVKLVTMPVIWEEKEKELNEGRIDCIWNGLSVNATRAESMNLSESYMKNDLVFIVERDSGYRSSEDLKGKRVGVQSGSSAEEQLESSGFFTESTKLQNDDNFVLMEMLDKDELDAVFADSIYAYYYINEYGKDYYLLPNTLESEDIAIGFRKQDQTLRDRVQEILREMKSDGTLAQISTKWFGTDVTTVR